MKYTVFSFLVGWLLSYFTASEFVPPSKPNYDELETLEQSLIHNDPNFISACREAAGYYRDASKNKDLSKTLLIVGANNGYRDFFHNFKCFADRLGVKFLSISLDEGIHKYLTSNQLGPTYLMGQIPGREKVNSEPSRFGGKNFNLIGCRKLEAVGAALKLGYDVIFSDIDIAILHDPIDYLFIPGIDYLHSTNLGCGGKWAFNHSMEGNTGFYSVRSNPRTIRTWDLSYRACARAPLYDDQTMFWLILRTNTNPSALPLPKCPKPTLYVKKKGKGNIPDYSHLAQNYGNRSQVVSCPLDDCMFSAGQLRDGANTQKLATKLSDRKDQAVMIHANWLSGKENKKNALVRTGLWIARKNPSQRTTLPDASMGMNAKNWTCASPSGRFMTL